MRQPRHLSRRSLGPKFSEGARLLWLLMIRRGWTQRDAKEALSVSEGTIPRLLFGDRRPDLELANKLQSTLKIRSSAWHEDPAKAFDPPEVLPVPVAERKRWAA